MRFFYLLLLLTIKIYIYKIYGDSYSELRPQVMYFKMKDPEIKLAIFQVGKVILMGQYSF